MYISFRIIIPIELILKTSDSPLMNKTTLHIHIHNIIYYM